MFTTWRYEPPEAKDENAAWPRRYDIWSIGCIILEFIVWLVDGTRGLDEFNKEIVNEFGAECHYFESKNRNRVAPFKVHEAVAATMERLSQHPECEDGTTALGDLLRVVKTRLLVVDLRSERSGEGTVRHEMANGQVQTRADAVRVKEALDDIIQKGNERPTYWLKGKTCDDVPSLYTTQAVTSESDSQSSLTVAWKHSFGGSGGLLTTDSSSLDVQMLTGSSKVG